MNIFKPDTMMKYIYVGAAMAASILLGISCGNNDPRKEIEKIVREWCGKTIVLPQNLKPTAYSSDSIYDPAKSKKQFKILNFTDSTGCTSCKLKLLIWCEYMKEIDTTLADKVDFLFYFHPRDEHELELILRADRFKLPVYIDRENEIDKLNGFPANQTYQCFLLDSNNKVLLVGNPSHQPRLWDLYKEMISGKKAGKVPITDIRIDRPAVEIADLKVGKKVQALFRIENAGDNPLVITHIDASCGCTRPSWDRKPVKPGDTSEIEVEIEPDKKGFFDKSLYVYCNTAEGRIKLKITGIAE